MGIPYLSEEWFKAVQERIVAPHRQRAGSDWRLQFDAERSGEHVRWVLAVRDGTLEFRAGELADAEIELHHSLSHAWQVFSEELNGDDALAGYTVVEEKPDGRYVGPPSPMELGQQAELQKLPAIPGASLEVQYEHPRGPFGSVSYFISFVDGQVQRMALGRCAEPDVVAEATFLQMAQVRHGDIGILDAVANGAKVKGSEGALALLAGILESPEFHRAELACGRSGFALAGLSELSSNPDYDAALDELRTITEAPVGL